MNIGKVKSIKLTKKTAYLAGVIIGDGHISDSFKSKTSKSKDYRIVIDIADKDYLYLITKLIKSVIRTKSIPKNSKPRGNRKERLCFQFRNKSFFYFLTRFLEIKKGAKSSEVVIPAKIKNSPESIKKYFLAGLFDTDGGFRGNTLGFTSASEELITDISRILIEFSIKHFSEKWLNQKYDKNYYGLKIRRKEIDKFLNTFPLQNHEKLVRINNKFCGDAGVVKRDRLF